MLFLHQQLQFPAENYPCIHVAGTNGKGSVCTKIAKAYEAAGFRVGLNTSPHIATFRERIQVNGELIPEKAVTDILQRLFSMCDQHKIQATFFELTTLLAFEYFAQLSIDVAIIETGIGGRLDATNIVYPTLSVITSISLEHTEILGSTIEQIATEKAGIIKSGVPVIIGPRVPYNVIEPIAKACNSPCIQIKGKFDHYDEENTQIAATALKYLEAPLEAIEHGVKAIPKCRQELYYSSQQPNTPIIFDVAHNPDGLRHLFSGIKKNFPNHLLHLVCGLSKNKDLNVCAQLMVENSDCIQVVESSNGRGFSTMELEQELIQQGMDKNKVTAASSIKEGIESALAASISVPTVIVVCGTFFIMAEARAILGIKEPSDPIELNESLRIFPSIVKLKL